MSSLELRWIGQSGFRLRDPTGGPVLFVDPFLSPHRLRSWPAPIGPEALAAADAVLVTHEHIDHFDRAALQAAAGLPASRFRLVLPRPLVEEALALGIARERVIGAQPNESIELAGVHIDPVPARHGVNVADAHSFGEELSGGLVRYLGYVIELGGTRTYHAGDTIPYQGQVERLRALGPEVALLPINGRSILRERLLNIVGNMDERQAAQMAHAIGARLLIPIHWDMFWLNRGSPRRLLAHASQAYPDLTVRVPTRDDSIFYPAREAGESRSSHH